MEDRKKQCLHCKKNFFPIWGYQATNEGFCCENCKKAEDRRIKSEEQSVKDQVKNFHRIQTSRSIKIRTQDKYKK